MNEDVFISLITDPDSPVDVPTAYAASVPDSEPQPTKDRTFAILVLGGLIVFILWVWLR